MTTTAKRIDVPEIRGLDGMSLAELELAMESGASKFAVCERNWPEDAPYAPDCNGLIARSEDSLAVMFHVRGLDLRARAMEDNGRSWEDSCCEFFISAPDDSGYFNFELTCIGSLLGAKGPDRNDRKRIDPSDLKKVIRHSSLSHREWNESGNIHRWTVAMLIPFDLLGLDPANLPPMVRGNFYKCGDLTAHPHFLSWNPIVTPRPDFHRPEFFGDIHFA